VLKKWWWIKNKQTQLAVLHKIVDWPPWYNLISDELLILNLKKTTHQAVLQTSINLRDSGTINCTRYWLGMIACIRFQWCAVLKLFYDIFVQYLPTDRVLLGAIADIMGLAYIILSLVYKHPGVVCTCFYSFKFVLKCSTYTAVNSTECFGFDIYV